MLYEKLEKIIFLSYLYNIVLFFFLIFSPRILYNIFHHIYLKLMLDSLTFILFKMSSGAYCFVSVWLKVGEAR